MQICNSVVVTEADSQWQEAEHKRTPESYTAVLNFLKEREPAADAAERGELLWRLARASKDCAKDSSLTTEQRKALMMSGRDYAKAATAAAPNNFKSFLWMGIMLGQCANFVGIREKVGSAFGIRDNFRKAIELNPQDAESTHCLGQWCYAIASMPWIERKASNAIGLSSTYDEALQLLLKAEELQPVYIVNLLLIAKCYEGQGKTEEALQYLDKVLACKAESPDDKAAYAEAQALKEKLSAKLKK